MKEIPAAIFIFLKYLNSHSVRPTSMNLHIKAEGKYLLVK